MLDLAHERRLGHSDLCLLCGVDEAGRGPLAGPVVAAAVVLPCAWLEGPLPDWCGEVNDSKQVKQARREALFELITTSLPHGVGIASAAEIDELNILQATLLAMRRAVEALPVRPHAALVDGNRPPALPCQRVETLVDGDALCLSIAAASIVAKVTRDKIMCDLAARYPGYGWERNAGYGTVQHRDALRTLGVTPEHRRSFAPVSQQLALNL
ncbi:ribonuclease HII [Indioceanicola profundi]|uniref:ribonuclease HII n=1 Tax=Indioceanicola profundi TaxID=2220096 RepID=UPI000E6ACB13|nr:ribonuclease HII [Indioceanicola profundi]